jgi:hypothetical protein
MSNEKMREEFEVWARKRSLDLEYSNVPGVGQFYECPRTLLALESWQASRAALCVELPLPVHRVFEEFDAGYNAAIHDCRFAIESTGVRTR